MRFEGRVALVTGSSRGIGRATAIRLASEGADVAVHYVRSAEHADAVRDRIRGLGRRAIAVQAEITDRDAVNKMVAQIESEIGAIDLLVNNAGDAGKMGFDELTPEEWDRIIAINLTGPFNVIWAIKEGMMERKSG